MKEDAASEALKRAYMRIEIMRKESGSLLTLPSFEEARSFRVLSEGGAYAKEWTPGNLVFVHPGVTLPSAPIFALRGTENVIILGEVAKLGNTMVVAPGERGIVSIGTQVSIKACSILLGEKKNSVLIGKGTQIQGAELSASESSKFIHIGDNCLFSSGIGIVTSDGHYIFDRSTGERINIGASVTIEDNVWIGRGVRVGKGVCIGKGGMVGQGSLVTKSTKPHSIYAGVPAKRIKSNIAWQKSGRVYRGPIVAASDDDFVR